MRFLTIMPPYSYDTSYCFLPLSKSSEISNNLFLKKISKISNFLTITPNIKIICSIQTVTLFYLTNPTLHTRIQKKWTQMLEGLPVAMFQSLLSSPYMPFRLYTHTNNIFGLFVMSFLYAFLLPLVFLWKDCVSSSEKVSKPN